MGDGMRTAALAFAAAILSAGSAAAQSPMAMTNPAVQPLSGYVEGFGGGDSSKSYYNQFNSPYYGGAGRLSWMFAPGWSVQGDVFGSHTVSDSYTSPNSYAYGATGGALHLSKRTPTYLIGVFGGFSDIEIEASSPYWKLDAFFYGGEGQVHFGNLTLYGQVGGINWPIINHITDSRAAIPSGAPTRKNTIVAINFRVRRSCKSRRTCWCKRSRSVCNSIAFSIKISTSSSALASPVPDKSRLIIVNLYYCWATINAHIGAGIGWRCENKRNISDGKKGTE